MQEVANAGNWRANAPKSITPSNFFGNSENNIVELENFISEEEQLKLINFSKNNKIWDVTVDQIDEDGLILYQANVWKDRVCTVNSLRASDPSILKLIEDMTARLKIEVEKFFNVIVQPTGPAIVRWPIGARQEPHADKEFHIGKEKGRSNDFPHYDIASLFYFSDDYEGGELYFPKQCFEFKPKPRSTYFFPGDMNYVHGVRPVTEGVRFTSPFFWTILKHTGEKQP
jgi:2OG-Fe(II) oxygenase superfamily